MKAQTLLRHATGLTMSAATAERAVRQRMEATGEMDHDRYLDQITPEEMTQLVELVVVPESWLFRDAQAFYAAVDLVKARMAATPAGEALRPVRILHIPCAGGEEPYSMAMALRDANVPKEAYSIDAYDLSPGCIARARSGVYGRNAFRAQDLAFRERFFTHLGENDYRIIDSIREQISFKQGNLVQFDTRARSRYYDVIFCRNLLIYFDKPTTKAAIGKLEALLADDGVLFAGYAEVPSFTENGFYSLPLRQAFALKKAASRPPVAAPAPAIKPRVAPRPAHAPASVSLAQIAAQNASLFAASQPDGRANAPGTPLRQVKNTKLAAPAENLLQQARSLADRGHFKEAAERCHAHLAVAPDAAEAYFILGILSEHAQNMTAAEDYWRRCIYLQPDHYEALCHLALLAEHNGNQSGAAALKARAARIFQRQSAN